MLSPDRADPFADSTPAAELTTYSDVMQGVELDKEKKEVLEKIRKKKEETSFPFETALKVFQKRGKRAVLFGWVKLGQLANGTFESSNKLKRALLT